mmetsp:Transcript_18406/g.62039  ORF Transcript_18406/g.62039 Transcript_18406/m.62039 type:complete len:318 (+) Transcript_18406:136-1089(+)
MAFAASSSRNASSRFSATRSSPARRRMSSPASTQGQGSAAAAVRTLSARRDAGVEARIWKKNGHQSSAAKCTFVAASPARSATRAATRSTAVQGPLEKRPRGVLASAASAPRLKAAGPSRATNAAVVSPLDRSADPSAYKAARRRASPSMGAPETTMAAFPTPSASSSAATRRCSGGSEPSRSHVWNRGSFLTHEPTTFMASARTARGALASSKDASAGQPLSESWKSRALSTSPSSYSSSPSVQSTASSRRSCAASARPWPAADTSRYAFKEMTLFFSILATSLTCASVKIRSSSWRASHMARRSASGKSPRSIPE